MRAPRQAAADGVSAARVADHPVLIRFASLDIARPRPRSTLYMGGWGAGTSDMSETPLFSNHAGIARQTAKPAMGPQTLGLSSPVQLSKARKNASMNARSLTESFGAQEASLTQTGSSYNFRTLVTACCSDSKENMTEERHRQIVAGTDG
jgi:hypothetical protein